MAKVLCWADTDTKGRKLGERMGLDTPVVLVVNDGATVSSSLFSCSWSFARFTQWILKERLLAKAWVRCERYSVAKKKVPVPGIGIVQPLHVKRRCLFEPAGTRWESLYALFMIGSMFCDSFPPLPINLKTK
jgi:hypothetical protein